MTDLADMYGRYTHYAWRLEARDDYNARDDATADLERFMRTGIVDRRTPGNNEWLAGIVAATKRGAQIGRIRLIGRPITAYTKFEMASYPDNIAAGEDVQVIERAWLPDPQRLYPDFWLFDDETVFVQHYDVEGYYLGAELDPDVHRYLSIRRELTMLSVSLAAHLARCGNDFGVAADTPPDARDEGGAAGQTA